MIYKKFKWIGEFSYRSNIIVYVGFFEGYPGTNRNVFGKIIATNNTLIYPKTFHPFFNCKPFKKCIFPKDKSLTYYIHENYFKLINRKIVKKEIIINH